MPEIPTFLVNDKFILGDENIGPNSQNFPLKSIIVPEIPVAEIEKLDPQESIKVKATFHLLHDLAHRGWHGHLSANGGTKFALVLGNSDSVFSKDIVRQMMLPRRIELIRKSAAWIKRVEPRIKDFFVSGPNILPLDIRPEIEVCVTQEQKDIFRYCRFLSSVPYSEYVGRRIHFLIRDAALPNRPIIGIAALGSSLLQISSRDKWIGWDNASRDIKKERIAHLMDLYVAVSIPPYSYLLGGKLICYMMVSNWIRETFASIYGDKLTLSKKRLVKDLVMIVTTSVYGRQSSQYNRIRYKGKRLFIPVGETEGFGTLHISENTFTAFRALLEEDTNPSHNFGDGANWRLRVVRDGMNRLGFNANECLNHGNPRGVYVVPLASNAQDFLLGKTDNVDYFDCPLEDLVNHWRITCLEKRIQNPEVMKRVADFDACSLHLSNLLSTP